MEIPCTLWYIGYANRLHRDFIFCIYFEYHKYHQYFSFFFFLYTFTAYLTVWLVALATLLVSLFLSRFFGCLLSIEAALGPRRSSLLGFSSIRKWLETIVTCLEIIYYYSLISSLSLSLSKTPSLSFVVVGATYAQAPCMVQVIFAWAEKSEITSATRPGEGEKGGGEGCCSVTCITKQNITNF